MIKTTPEHFALFKSECEKQLERLGLKCWEIEYIQEEAGDNFADVSYRTYGMTACIRLNTEIKFDYADLEGKIKRAALHECLHLLLASLSLAIDTRLMSQEIQEQENHRIIRVLEKLL